MNISVSFGIYSLLIIKMRRHSIINIPLTNLFIYFQMFLKNKGKKQEGCGQDLFSNVVPPVIAEQYQRLQQRLGLLSQLINNFRQSRGKPRLMNLDAIAYMSLENHYDYFQFDQHDPSFILLAKQDIQAEALVTEKLIFKSFSLFDHCSWFVRFSKDFLQQLGQYRKQQMLRILSYVLLLVQYEFYYKNLEQGSSYRSEFDKNRHSLRQKILGGNLYSIQVSRDLNMLFQTGLDKAKNQGKAGQERVRFNHFFRIQRMVDMLELKKMEGQKLKEQIFLADYQKQKAAQSHSKLPYHFLLNQNLVKSYVEISGASQLVQTISNIPHFHIELTDQEKDLIGTEGNILAIGRSGTGKTTSAVLRLFAIQLIFKMKFENQFQINQKIKKGKQDYELQKNIGMRNIFLTASPILTKQLQQYYNKMEQALKKQNIAKSKANQAQLKVKEHEVQVQSFDFQDEENADQVQEPNEKIKIPKKKHVKSRFQNDVSLKLNQNSSQLLDQLEENEDAQQITENQISQSKEKKNLIQLDFKVTNFQSLYSLKKEDFPGFFSVRAFVKLIDATLAQPFFKRTMLNSSTQKQETEYNHSIRDDDDYQQDSISYYVDDSSIDQSELQSEYQHQIIYNQEREKKKERKKVLKRTQIDYEVFFKLFWSNYSRQAISKKKSSYLIWGEIYSKIKGSARAHLFPGMHLPKDVYLNQSSNSSFQKQEKQYVYKIFQDYEKWRVTSHRFDMMDAVNHILNTIRIHGYHGPSIHYLMIDEVQDLTHAQVYLLSTIVTKNLFYCGDTAQTIAKGIQFRFSDLRSLFNPKFFSGALQLKKPVEKQLTVNFRSHNNILQLANSVVSCIQYLFPKTIDRLKKQISDIDGPKPMILMEQSQQLLSYLLGNQKINKLSNLQELAELQFGYHQVIIVRDEKAREQLPPILKSALCLTIHEAKGLQFEDVVLYNFFSGCQCPQEWQVLRYLKVTSKSMSLHEYQSFITRRSPQEAEEVEQCDLDCSTFIENGQVKIKYINKQQKFRLKNFTGHNELCVELKMLYTAITRPKKKLIIYDQNPGPRKMLDRLWSQLDVVYFVTSENLQSIEKQIIFTNSLESQQAEQDFDPEQEWRKQGQRLYQKGYYSQALKCFMRIDDDYMVRNCKIGADIDNCKKRMSQIESEMYGLENNYDFFNHVNENQINKERARLKREQKKIMEEYCNIGDNFRKVAQLRSAADCYYKGERYSQAAQCYQLQGLYKQAADCYLKGHSYMQAARCYIKTQLYIKAIQCLHIQERWLQIVQLINQNFEKFKQIERRVLLRKYMKLALQDISRSIQQDPQWRPKQQFRWSHRILPRMQFQTEKISKVFGVFKKGQILTKKYLQNSIPYETYLPQQNLNFDQRQLLKTHKKTEVELYKILSLLEMLKCVKLSLFISSSFKMPKFVSRNLLSLTLRLSPISQSNTSIHNNRRNMIDGHEKQAQAVLRQLTDKYKFVSIGNKKDAKGLDFKFVQGLILQGYIYLASKTITQQEMCQWVGVLFSFCSFDAYSDLENILINYEKSNRNTDSYAQQYFFLIRSQIFTFNRVASSFLQHIDEARSFKMEQYFQRTKLLKLMYYFHRYSQKGHENFKGKKLDLSEEQVKQIVQFFVNRFQKHINSTTSNSVVYESVAFFVLMMTNQNYLNRIKPIIFPIFTQFWNCILWLRSILSKQNHQNTFIIIQSIFSIFGCRIVQPRRSLQFMGEGLSTVYKKSLIGKNPWLLQKQKDGKLFAYECETNRQVFFTTTGQLLKTIKKQFNSRMGIFLQNYCSYANSIQNDSYSDKQNKLLYIAIQYNILQQLKSVKQAVKFEDQTSILKNKQIDEMETKKEKISKIIDQLLEFYKFICKEKKKYKSKVPEVKPEQQSEATEVKPEQQSEATEVKPKQQSEASEVKPEQQSETLDSKYSIQVTHQQMKASKIVQTSLSQPIVQDTQDQTKIQQQIDPINKQDQQYLIRLSIDESQALFTTILQLIVDYQLYRNYVSTIILPQTLMKYFKRVPNIKQADRGTSSFLRFKSKLRDHGIFIYLSTKTYYADIESKQIKSIIYQIIHTKLSQVTNKCNRRLQNGVDKLKNQFYLVCKTCLEAIDFYDNEQLQKLMKKYMQKISKRRQVYYECNKICLYNLKNRHNPINPYSNNKFVNNQIGFVKKTQDQQEKVKKVITLLQAWWCKMRDKKNNPIFREYLGQYRLCRPTMKIAQFTHKIKTQHIGNTEYPKLIELKNRLLEIYYENKIQGSFDFHFILGKLNQISQIQQKWIESMKKVRFISSLSKKNHLKIIEQSIEQWQKDFRSRLK